MNEFKTIGMNAVSADELEHTAGGFITIAAPLIAGFGLGFAITKGVTRGGGEALPGLGQFLVGTTAIATAAGGHPQ